MNNDIKSLNKNGKNNFELVVPKWNFSLISLMVVILFLANCSLFGYAFYRQQITLNNQGTEILRLDNIVTNQNHLNTELNIVEQAATIAAKKADIASANAAKAVKNASIFENKMEIKK